MRHPGASLGIIVFLLASENLALFFTEPAKSTTSVDVGSSSERSDASGNPWWQETDGAWQIITAQAPSSPPFSMWAEFGSCKAPDILEYLLQRREQEADHICVSKRWHRHAPGLRLPVPWLRAASKTAGQSDFVRGRRLQWWRLTHLRVSPSSFPAGAGQHLLQPAVPRALCGQGCGQGWPRGHPPEKQRGYHRHRQCHLSHSCGRRDSPRFPGTVVHRHPEVLGCQAQGASQQVGAWRRGERSPSAGLQSWLGPGGERVSETTSPHALRPLEQRRVLRVVLPLSSSHPALLRGCPFPQAIGAGGTAQGAGVEMGKSS